ncbi:glycoside hydrolase family 2 protein [Trueperella pyogenes]|uniref:glycoside hydrolase family 2 protein n=1 Tax=Trueperella pyogenes TaxID=1661 RepID=UPI00345D4817
MLINEDLHSLLVHPRPQLRRKDWVSLNGAWQFAEDPDDRGLLERWFDIVDPYQEEITVPFPPGSRLSEREDFSDCDIVWYRKVITDEDLPAKSSDRIHRLNFEAVDFETDVWVNGDHLIAHVGGGTSFSVDLPEESEYTVVVRAQDRRFDKSQPRGKQDWSEAPHGIWYRRTTGIWRDVWVEAVPRIAIEQIYWTFDLDSARLSAEVAFSTWVSEGNISVSLSLRERKLAHVTASVTGLSATVAVEIPQARNRTDWHELLWFPGNPNLVDAEVELEVPGSYDRVFSYVGLRSVDSAKGYLRINRKPIFVRGVLDQGYWRESFFTAPSLEKQLDDLRLTIDMGFNTVRVHQRTPDRRYLAMADHLGIMVWAEFPAAFEYSRRAVNWTMAQWNSILDRDASSPSIVVWMPFNESWGVDLVSTNPSQRHFVNSIIELTRAKDATRLVVANDGWEQLDTDIVSTHDYATTGEELAVAYRGLEEINKTVHGVGPQGRPILLSGDIEGRPVMVTEFGGISLKESEESSWGYAIVGSPAEFADAVSSLFEGLYASTVLTGWCYTQLTDTLQETNGLLTEERVPKIPLERIRTFVLGDKFHEQIRPRRFNQLTGGEE